MESIFALPEFQMSLLLFVALGGYLIASRINQSAVIGLILVGLIVGPSALGWITYTDFVRGLAHLGAVILLFVIGLEFNVKEILSLRNGVIAGVGVIIPWIGGYWISLVFGFSTASAIFIGTALTATSIAITANVLKEMGKLQTGAAKAIIGAAVIDDVLSLLALAISTDVVSGTLSAAGIAFVAAKAVAFIVIGGAFGIFVVSKYIGRLDETGFCKKFPEFIFIFAMMVAFLYAMCAEAVGLSAIVGAFIAGVSFERVEVSHSRSFREGAEYLQIIFASIFFVSLGILADIHTVTPEIALFLVVLTIVAILTKVIGCGLPATLMGLCRKDGLIVGFGMAPRGEVAMIVALIGLEAKVIDQSVYVVLVLMSLLTTIITPIVYRNWFFRGEYCTYDASGKCVDGGK
ncbi:MULTISPECIES: cation:proton antiporter [unclassified Methanoregula]|uniref:cation:proton antiporter n=1 Tax=unclassified Methanoregula TaxID=2649730 RepID=UPI0009C63116|nr:MULTISPECIES: cation:proton antiporter [unclassified Methanoregula]OPX64892.1 MAG: putative cation:proton antiport protein [Methanoregula sp. PtaB.Bin085]OPY32944.1 MAG: putative cation:proton antiport protein [Methanoregula sp. PtaU1.Bin006]